MSELQSVKIPFTGFYESDHDYEIDRALELIFETDRDSGGDHAIPDKVYMGGVDFSAIHDEYCAAYCEAFAEEFESITGIPLPVTFEEMTSPREYNFTTDRAFCSVPLETLQRLYDESAKEDHASLKAEIEARHSSRSGFISFYSNNFEEWQAKPLEDWDHNEYETLIRAILIMHGEDFDESENFRAWSLFECNDKPYHIVESHVSKELFDFADCQAENKKALDFEAWQQNPAFAVYLAECEENGKTALDFEDWQAVNPESESYRCDQTLDLFEGVVS